MVAAAQDALALYRMRAAIILQKNCPLQTNYAIALCQIGAPRFSSCGPLPALLKGTARSNPEAVGRTFATLQGKFSRLPVPTPPLLHVLRSRPFVQSQAPEPHSWGGTKRCRYACSLAQCRSKPGDGTNGVNFAAPSAPCDLPPVSTQAIDWPSPAAEAELTALEPMDCIFVLGGGQRNNGGVPQWVQKRLDATYRAYVAQDKRCPIVVMGGGTSHKPPVLNKDGYVIHEGTSCAAYLMEKHGVDPDHILKEWASYDTIANGYFALTAHAIPRGWRRIMMVTSAFHFERSRLIFEWMFGLQGSGVALRNDSASNGTGGRTDGLDGLRLESRNGDNCGGRDLAEREASQHASSSKGLSSDGLSRDGGAVERMNRGPAARTPGSQGFSMHYLRASDEGEGAEEGMNADVIQARLRKEADSIRNLQTNLIPRIRTLPEMHRWLHIEHKAYNVADQAAFGEDPTKLTDPALASY